MPETDRDDQMTTVCRAKVVQKLKKMLKFSEKSNIQTYGKQRKKPNIHKGHRAFLAGAEGLEPSARGFGAHCELYSHYMGRKESGDSESKNVDQMTTADLNKVCFLVRGTASNNQEGLLNWQFLRKLFS